jgi:predicted phosphodiesterase
MKLSQFSDLRSAKNIGIIGDTHEPFCHPDYLNFCYEIFNYFQCKHIVHIGDEVDNHAISYHEKDPDGHSAGKETEMAQEALYRWYAAFDKVKVCIGNHSALPYRKAHTHGIPKKFIKSYNEIWDAPKGWEWADEWEIYDTLITHGTGSAGQNGAIKRAIQNRQSTAIGHIHSHGGVNYSSSRNDIIYGLNVGCGIDIKAYAMAYSKPFPQRPTLGCGLILDEGRTGLFFPMDLGRKYKFIR